MSRILNYYELQRTDTGVAEEHSVSVAVKCRLQHEPTLIRLKRTHTGKQSFKHLRRDMGLHLA